MTLRSDTKEEEGRPYSVNLWQSDPDEGNDDCITGDDFSTKEEAVAVFENPWSHFNRKYFESSTAFFEIYGPDAHSTRKNESYEGSQADSDAWLNEIAMQNGMAFGCDGYNDTYGW